MTDLNNLTDLINKLRCKIKNISLIQHHDKSCFFTTQILKPCNNSINKKYMGLQFNDKFNNNSDNKSFIILRETNNIISYYLTITIPDIYKNNKDCFSFSLGIKTNNKIKTIKNSKTFYSANNIIDNQITVSNTSIYSSKEKQELCLIVKCPYGYKSIDFDNGILTILSV